MKCPTCGSKMEGLGVTEKHRYDKLASEWITVTHVGYRCPTCGTKKHIPPLPGENKQ